MGIMIKHNYNLSHSALLHLYPEFITINIKNSAIMYEKVNN